MTACTIAWNEEDFIGHAWQSVRALVDDYILVDCNLKGFGGNLPNQSIDRTVEMARRFGNVTVVQPETPLEECVKREVYLKMFTDWCCVIDADDIMLGDVKRLRIEALDGHLGNAVDMPIYTSLEEFHHNRFHRWTILFNKKWGFHYGNHHWERLNGEGKVTDGNGRWIDYCYVVSLQELRPLQRTMQKLQYRIHTSQHSGERF
jgi:hypothetical protein